jgi:hypothetical protein
VYWWLYPSRIAVFILMPIYLGCSDFDAADYLLYRQHNIFLTGDRVWLGLTGLAAFAISSFCAEFGADGKDRQIQIDTHALSVVLAWLYVITLFAYAIFLFPIILNPHVVTELATGSANAASMLRDTLERIPGVTTLSTLQSLCVVLHLLHRRITGSSLPRIFQFSFAAVVVACLLRAWLWSERLAALELVVPIAILAIGWPGGRRKLLLTASPLFGLLVVFGLFCAGEYFRSWQFYRATWHGSFVAFAWARFVGYYATALNNGALCYAMTDRPYFPLGTALWFYKLPIWPVLQISFPPEITGALLTTPNTTQALLRTYANVEFNNTSGIFQPFLDYGPIGGVLCWTALGSASGWLFKSFANSRASGLILFPVWYIGVLEILRIFYWGESRFFPVIVSGLLIAAYFGMKAERAQRYRAAKAMLSSSHSRGPGYA